MKTFIALKHLQAVLQRHFGKKSKSTSGEGMLYIGPDKVLLTNMECRIVAKGPVQIATVLVRKRRKRI